MSGMSPHHPPLLFGDEIQKSLWLDTSILDCLMKMLSSRAFLSQIWVSKRISFKKKGGGGNERNQCPINIFSNPSLFTDLTQEMVSNQWAGETVPLHKYFTATGNGIKEINRHLIFGWLGFWKEAQEHWDKLKSDRSYFEVSSPPGSCTNLCSDNAEEEEGHFNGRWCDSQVASHLCERCEGREDLLWPNQRGFWENYWVHVSTEWRTLSLDLQKV